MIEVNVYRDVALSHEYWNLLADLKFPKVTKLDETNAGKRFLRPIHMKLRNLDTAFVRKC